MAKMEIVFPTGFLEKVNALESRLQPVVEDTLEAGAEVVLRCMKERFAGQIGFGGEKYKKNRSTGELVRALGVSPVKVNRNGDYDVKVGFAEPRRDGGVNALLANVLEHGKPGQPPRPILKPTRSAARKPAVAAMREAFERGVEKL